MDKKKCEDCGVLIDSKYIVCSVCAAKRKLSSDKTESQNTQEILKALSANNNNLYHLVRLVEILVREQLYITVKWNRDQKDFEEIKLGDK